MTLSRNFTPLILAAFFIVMSIALLAAQAWSHEQAAEVSHIDAADSSYVTADDDGPVTDAVIEKTSI